MITKEQLVAKVKTYDPQTDEEALVRAYDFAAEAHKLQRRESGEPYFSHLVGVALILTEMKLDNDSIVTALLHDTIEDTDTTLETINQQFGAKIGSLVDGVTKLTQIELQSSQTKQAENFRKLVLAMSNDIRVLLVKLADRLHNMRTLHHVKAEEKRKRVARETMDIYVPLAERIGMHHIKDELEDLSFAEVNFDARNSILARLRFLREEDKSRINTTIRELKQLFKRHSLDVDISGREKSPYSIWRKMQQKNIPFEQLSDIIAFRVCVKSIEECYKALGVIHATYLMVPGKFKDYISTPKPNNYQSLHTTVIGPDKQRVEIQIRTHEMHEVNEYGVAAHWKYKQGAGGSEGREYRWLRGLLEIINNASNPEEFLEHTRLEMYQDQVFCFTPKGDLIPLPHGSTPIDFAYAVHSDIGNHCVGVKINGRMAPLRTTLQNGDQVDITVSRAQSPSATWEKYAVTGKARACIRRYIRTQKRSQFAELGRAIIQKAFKKERLSFSEKQAEKHLKTWGCATINDLYALLGEGIKNSQEVIKTLYPEHTSTTKEQAEPAYKGEAKEDETAVALRGLIPGMAIHYAGCCHPLPGDKIVGIVITGSGVTIHTSDCENLEQFADEPDRWLEVAWSDTSSTDAQYVGRLHVVVYNRVGALANLTTLISQNQGNILNLKITNRTEAFYDILVDVEVRDNDHLNNIMASMRSSSLLSSVERSRG